MRDDLERPKIDLRRSRLSRQTIRETFTEAARNRGSLELEIKNGPIKQTLEVIERLKSGNTAFTVVDYDGEVVSNRTLPHDNIPLREFSHKPIQSRPLVNAVFYLKNIMDIWYDGPSNYYPPIYDRDALDHDPVRVEAWELPTHPLKVFRLNHDKLLVACCDSDALQLVMMARRKTVRVSEASTTGYRGLHTPEEIIDHTLREAADRSSDAAFHTKANRGLRMLDSCLTAYRKHLL